MLYDPADIAIQKHFMAGSRPAVQHYETILSLLRTSASGLSERDLARRTGLVQTTMRTVLRDLEEQGFIGRGPERTYIAFARSEPVNFSIYDHVRSHKEQELQDICNYALTTDCYMGYLSAYLGDEQGHVCGKCGNCQPANFPPAQLSERIRQLAVHFLEGHALPRIEKRGEKRPVHEEGLSLSYYGKTAVGQLVRASKYEGAGPFSEDLVQRAVNVIRAHYPIEAIDGIVSVPPTKSGRLVEIFALRVAELLGKEYLAALVKVRATREQKEFTNRVQKEDNVSGAFAVTRHIRVAGKTLLVIDDIYDSGYTLREVGKALMGAGAKAVYPFTITRTRHSDDR